MVASPTITNPFPGLRPFDLDEEHLFFGREGQADELLERLHQTGFLAVVGSSGSGKSSLVRAGLLPSLYSGFLNEASSHWRVALMRPGNAPIRNLAEALNQPDVFGQAPEDADRDLYTELTETTLRRGDLGLVEVVKQARMAVRESLLLVIDQFEELFRFKRMADTVAADDEAAAFVKLFLTAVQQEEVPIYVVLTMRSDFLGDCAQFRGLPEAINDSQYLIPRMTRDQRRSAVEGPVAVGEATIMPRLVNRVLNDMGDDPDQLPILQHAMMRTWRRWSQDHGPNEPLDLRHYEAVGGMTGALSQHADEIYQSLDDRSQTVAEKLFKCLTEKGPDNREIRRPTSLAEVCAVAGATPEEVIRVVDTFRATGRSFLIPPEGVELGEASVLDISHESFMRVWRRLKDWVDDEAQSAQIYRRLAETAALHEAGQAGYLQDPELTVGLTWRQVVQPNEVWAGRYAPEFEETMAFLDASAGDKELVQRRKNRVLYSFIGSLLMLSGVAMGAAGYAYVQWGVANEQTELAKEQTELANDRGDELEKRGKDLEDALGHAELARKEADSKRSEAVEAKKKAETANTEAQKRKQEAEQAQEAEAEQRQLAETAVVRAEEGEAEAQRQTNIARDQTKLAEENAIQAQRATARAEQEQQKAKIQALNSDIQAEALTVENLMASNLNFKALLTALELGQEIKQRESISSVGQILLTMKSHGKLVSAVSSDLKSSILPSRRLQAISVLREAYYAPDYLELQTLGGHSDAVWSVSFAPDGQTLASASGDGTVKLWDKSGRELQTLEGHSNAVWSVSFAPDGQTLASASTDGTVKLWDKSGRELQTLEGHSNAVWSVSFAPDGQTLASASADGTVKLWNFELEDLIAKSCGWISDYLTTHPQDLNTLKACQTPSLLAEAAPTLVVKALQVARRGKFDESVAQLQIAQSWNSLVDLDPDTDALDSDPRIVAARRVALHRVETGERLAERGDVEGAIIAYREALTLDPTIDLIPSTEDIRETDPVALVATGRLNQGKELAQSGNIDEAILAYQQAQDFGADIIAADWEMLCWNGSRYEASAEVLFACDNSLALAPDNNKWGWQARSIARALVNDLTGAAQDLEVVVDWLDSDQILFLPGEFKALRQQWLSILQNLENPFTPEIIEQASTSALPPGNVQVTLDWTGPVDLDMDVFDPNGDRRDIERYSNCAEPFPTTTQIDNVLWPLDSSPPLGNYTVTVKFDEACSEDGPTSADFSLNVLFQGNLHTFTGKVSVENPSEEFEFSIPPNLSGQ
ncbi:WD40 repeat domain-containing protein [Leptothoe spongobia]|uniref:Novel STAND NTPase 1 domain-containing protein n=1 Tax=Leptothoe spongobia TAU-MAC 1115 TaxID=1967444 RepID=A0A947GP24_9CYAN|nr:WD40 repeat domain-containing protein [Leptothoe spongobia]MBT9316331.1 hypothetical protein [Leptothoe spongobia TAU-MAC 1115]